MHCSKLIYSLLASVSLVFAPSANGAVNLNLTTSISGGKNIGPGYLNLTAIANSYASSGGGIQVGPYSLNFTMPNGSTIYANLGPSQITKPGLYNLGASVASTSYGPSGSVSYSQQWDGTQNKWIKYVLSGNVAVHVIYYYNPSNAGDLPSNLNLTLSSFLNGISSSNWFSTLAKYYNTGYITGATSTNTLGPSYVSGVKLLYTDFFDCRYGWPGRTVPNVGNTVCQTLVTANDLQNVIMEVTNDVTRYPNSPRPNGDVVELVILGSSIQESFNPLSGLILGNGYCGYHGTFSNTDSRYSASAVGIWYKFAVVGASSSSTQNCIVVPASTSNGVLTDNIIFLVAHEIMEAITDPLPPGSSGCYSWCDAQSNEIGDKCSGAITNLQTDGSGKQYNVAVGTSNFVLPAIWDPTSQACSMGSTTNSIAAGSTCTARATWACNGLNLLLCDYGATASILVWKLSSTCASTQTCVATSSYAGCK